MFGYVFEDFWHVYLGVVEVLRANGRSIWTMSEENEKRNKNIFTNLSNPHFPEDKKLSAFISILESCPYDEEYMSYLVNVYGDNEQTKQIKEYFGY